MNAPAPRSARHGLLPTWPASFNWSDLMSTFESMPTWPSMDRHMIRVEEQFEEDRYVLRAELPGMDPEKDVNISVRGGQLTISAERNEKREEGTRSEFRYGQFFRSLPLPAGAHEDEIDASYDDGILTVTVPVSDTSSQAKRIEVKPAASKGDKGSKG